MAMEGLYLTLFLGELDFLLNCSNLLKNMPTGSRIVVLIIIYLCLSEP